MRQGSEQLHLTGSCRKRPVAEWGREAATGDWGKGVIKHVTTVGARGLIPGSSGKWCGTPPELSYPRVSVPQHPAIFARGLLQACEVPEGAKCQRGTQCRGDSWKSGPGAGSGRVESHHVVSRRP